MLGFPFVCWSRYLCGRISPQYIDIQQQRLLVAKTPSPLLLLDTYSWKWKINIQTRFPFVNCKLPRPRTSPLCFLASYELIMNILPAHKWFCKPFTATTKKHCYCLFVCVCVVSSDHNEQAYQYVQWKHQVPGEGCVQFFCHSTSPSLKSHRKLICLLCFECSELCWSLLPLRGDARAKGTPRQIERN